MEGGDGHHDPSMGPVDPNGKGCGCVILFIVYLLLLPLVASPDFWGRSLSTLIAMALTVLSIYLAIRILRS
jgi:hypothetical protein